MARHGTRWSTPASVISICSSTCWRRRDEVAPKTKLGLMTVGRGYVCPQFDKMLPKDIPFATI